ncbi:MAG: DUF6328 family protein [Myxococcales bacterium]|nr:DUF6328 family protein [Myxococcales bacterium]
MGKLSDKVQLALDENRMLVLGVQVLIGFDYRAAFERGFERLPRAAQLLKLSSLTVLLVTFALLITPGADHRICERGEDSAAFHRLASTFASLALFPFAAALGMDLAVACYGIAGLAGAIVAGAVMGAVALAMWYGLELVCRPNEQRRQAMEPRDDHEKTPVKNKIRHALTEARVVLPGVQALLGFQFATMLLEGFDKLPLALKWLHFASLGCMAIAIVLLITPAAWHRIVEKGEENERFHRFASAMVVAALVPIALGLSGDFFVVSYKITQSAPAAAGLGGAAFVMFFGLWFGLTLARRHALASET